MSISRRVLPLVRANAHPALALALAAGLLVPVPAAAAQDEPTALLTGELALVADAHRTGEPSSHADELDAFLRLPSGLTVPVDSHLVEGAAPSSRVTLEVPVPDRVVGAVEAGARVAVPDTGAPATRTGAPATERVVVPAAALDAASATPAPARSDLAQATALAVAAAADLGDASLVAATAPAPVAATGTPKKVTAVVVTHEGRTDARYTDAEVSRIIGAGSDFWADQSNGSITFAQQGATTRYASAVPCARPFDLWNEAAARSGYTGGADSYLVLFLPRSGPGCSYGLGTIGSGPGAGGYSYVSDTSWPALAHEWGHNMSLQHADRAVCGSAADGTRCTEQPYGDLPDVMSSTSTPAAAGNASAFALGRLGLLPAGDRVAITTTGVTSVTLSPLSDHDGVRSASVVDPRNGITYYLENRENAGRDTYGWAGRSGQTFGLRVMRSGTSSKSLVLDASPTSGGTDPDVVVKPGATFSSVAGGVRVRTRVEASGAVTASVSVAPAGATHWLTGPVATAVAPVAPPRTTPVGAALTLTGKVTGPAGRVPTGTVTATSPAGATASAAVAANGSYSLAWTPTALGAATVTLTYAPADADFITSSRAVTLSVVAPTQVVTTAPSSVVASGASGASVTLPVTVSAPGRVGLVPAGTVSVSEGTRRLATATLVGGSASVRLPVLVGGPHALSVAYTPPATGPTTAPSTTTASITVAAAASTTTATLPAAHVATTEAGKVTVVVAAPGVAPTGTVTVRKGSTTLGTATLASGRATVVLAKLPVGMHDLVASFAGEVRALPSQSAPVRLEVTTLPRSRVTATVARTTTAAQPVVVVRGTSTLGPATGAVTVSRGGAVVASGTFVGGAVSIKLPLQPAGTVPLVVRHASSATVEGGSAMVSLVVSPARPTITTTLSTTTKAASATATMAVTVTSPAGTPTGTVQLRSGSTVLGTATLSGGSATLTVPRTLPVGRRSLTAVYSGSSQLTAVTSAAKTITVTA